MKPDIVLEFRDLAKIAGDTGGLILFTSNLHVKKNGQAVLGRGTAFAAQTIHPMLAYEYGQHLLTRPKSNIWVSRAVPHIGAFPVKPDYVSNRPEHLVSHMRGKFKQAEFAAGWAAKADPMIIRRSWRDLCVIAHRWPEVWVPFLPGTGAGEMPFRASKSLIPRDLPKNIKFYSR